MESARLREEREAGYQALLRERSLLQSILDISTPRFPQLETFLMLKHPTPIEKGESDG